MTTQPMKRWSVAVAALVLVSGCAFLGRQLFQKPTVELHDVRLTGLGLAGGNLDVVLRVYNPNSYRLDATKMHYQLLVDTVPLANGEITDRNAFPGGDTATVHIPVHFDYAGVGAVGRELLQSGAVNYRVVGDVTVDSPIGSRRFPFTSKGRFTSVNASIH